MDKKYTLIITSEDSRYSNGEKQLSFYSENPWEGCLEGILNFDNISELNQPGEYEGLFYQLYSNESGLRIGYGTIDPDYPRLDIEQFEKSQITCNSKKGQLIILTGLSAAGKNTLAEKLMELSDSYVFSVSATTRSPREGEKHEVDYYFISDALFDQMKSEGDFMETAEYCGYKYGTILKQVTNKLNQGRDVILILECTGEIGRAHV